MGRLGTWGWISACGHDPELNSALATSTWEKRSPLDLTPPLVSMAREAFELVYGHWWGSGEASDSPAFFARRHR